MNSRFLFYTMLMAFLMAASIVVSCNKKREHHPVVCNTLTEYVAKDALFMDSVSHDYEYVQSCVIARDYMDESDTISIDMAVNVFQVRVPTADGYSCDVYEFFHNRRERVDSLSVLHDCLFSDCCDMRNEDDHMLSLEEAHGRMMLSYFPVPHTKKVILVQPFGKYISTPQYLFCGDDTLRVDAVTKEVKL